MNNKKVTPFYVVDILRMGTSKQQAQSKGKKGGKDEEAKDNTKRTRILFSGKQLHKLESVFENKKYLSEEERDNLAVEMGLRTKQVMVWFQNRRTKWKQQEDVSVEELKRLRRAKASKTKKKVPEVQQRSERGYRRVLTPEGLVFEDIEIGMPPAH